MAAALLIALWSSAAPPSPDTAALDQAIKLFDNFDDAQATEEFRKIVAAQPTAKTTAKAHLYLGLIAFNRGDPDLAQKEFRLAVHADSSVELPQGSPKARMALEEARGGARKELDAARGQVPRAAVTEAAAPEPAHSHALALTLGSMGVATAALAIVGAVEVASFNSTMSSVSSGHTVETGTVGAGQQANAQTWQIIGIVCAVAAAAGATGAVLTW